MSDDEQKSPKMVPMPCAQCGRPPVVGYELESGVRINLCFQHMQDFEAAKMQRIEMYRRLAEDAEDNVADVFGMPRKFRADRAPAPQVTVQHITIAGDNLGVVNTGTVGSITNNINVISSHDQGLATQFKALTETLIASTSLTNDQKQEAAELIAEVSSEAAKPATQRKPRAVINAMATALGQLLTRSSELATIWQAIEPHLR